MQTNQDEWAEFALQMKLAVLASIEKARQMTQKYSNVSI